MTEIDTTSDLFYLPPNQVRALNALLQTGTIAEASALCGLSPRTIKRYLSEETFDKTYRKQRMLILQETVANLTRVSAEATQKLESSMSCGDVNTELRAACRVLDYFVKTVELERRIREFEDLEERIAALEAEQEVQGNGYKGGWG